MKGLFIPGITEEMFRNGCLESIDALMAEGEIYDIEYSPWIPCTEKLPEVGDTYLVTVTYKGEVLAVDAACFGPDCHYIDDMWATYNDWIEDDPDLYHITAWMPLPDAYEGGEKNGK